MSLRKMGFGPVFASAMIASSGHAAFGVNPAADCDGGAEENLLVVVFAQIR